MKNLFYDVLQAIGVKLRSSNRKASTMENAPIFHYQLSILNYPLLLSAEKSLFLLPF